MVAFRKTVLALGGIAALSLGMASFAAYADGPGDEGDSEWSAYLKSTEHGGGANLSMPASASTATATTCGDVKANPAGYTANIVRYCSRH